MGLSIEWLLEFIDGNAKEETKDYDCTETMWGVLKAYAFFYYNISWQGNVSSWARLCIKLKL